MKKKKDMSQNQAIVTSAVCAISASLFVQKIMTYNVNFSFLKFRVLQEIFGLIVGILLIILLTIGLFRIVRPLVLLLYPGD